MKPVTCEEVGHCVNPDDFDGVCMRCGNGAKTVTMERVCIGSVKYNMEGKVIGVKVNGQWFYPQREEAP